MEIDVVRFDNRDRQTLLPYQKIELLYENKVHGLTSNKIAKKYNLCMSSTHETILKYKRNGKIFN